MLRSTAFTATLLLGASASAHVSISSGPAAADKSQKITFGIGHGCEDASGNHYDTKKIRIELPAGFASVRALPATGFGTPVIAKSGTTVTSIEWSRATADLLSGDDAFYDLTFRARVPNTPFTQVTFTVHQTCQVGAVEQTTTWTGTTGDTPGPALTIVPARTNATGWNKLTLSTAVAADMMGVFFSDALIVWKGASAFSANSNTRAQILATSGVTELTGGLAAGDDIWVRY